MQGHVMASLGCLACLVGCMGVSAAEDDPGQGGAQFCDILSPDSFFQGRVFYWSYELITHEGAPYWRVSTKSALPNSQIEVCNRSGCASTNTREEGPYALYVPANGPDPG